MPFRMFVVILCILVASLLPVSAFATAWQPTVNRLLIEKSGFPNASLKVTFLNADAADNYFENCRSPEFELTQTRQKLVGRVVVKATCAGVRQRPFFLQAEVAVRTRYWVAARPIKANETLSAADIETREGSLQRLPRDVILATEITREQLLAQWSLRRSVSAGEALTETLLNKANVVSYGDNITVVYRGQGFQIEQQAKALEQAAIGEIIRVQLQNRKTLNVKVTGEQRAEVAK